MLGRDEGSPTVLKTFVFDFLSSTKPHPVESRKHALFTSCVRASPYHYAHSHPSARGGGHQLECQVTLKQWAPTRVTQLKW